MSEQPTKTYDFGHSDDVLEKVDLSQLMPTTEPGEDDNEPSLEDVRKVAEKAGWKSREGKSSKAKKKPTRKRRVYRTGRNEQFNNRVRPQVIDGFHQIAEQKNWVMGETLEHALEALQEKLNGSDREQTTSVN